MLFQVRPGNLAGHRGVSLPRASKSGGDGVCWHGGGEWGRLNVETTSSEWTQDRSIGLQKAPAVMTVLWTSTFPGTWDDT